MKNLFKKTLACAAFVMAAAAPARAQQSPMHYLADEARKVNTCSPLNPFNHRALTAKEKEVAGNVAIGFGVGVFAFAALAASGRSCRRRCGV